MTSRTGVTGPGAPPPVLAANAPPKIGGSPAAQAVAGTSYSFTPSSSDADGDPLTFSVSNLPAWARFDTATGTLSGTPTASDLGSYQNIAISATDGVHQTVLSPFSITVVAGGAASVTLSWQPPTQKVNGTPLKDLAGFRIYYGRSSGQYDHTVTLDNPGLTRYVVDGLTPGTWYFTATAFRRSGEESGFAPEARKTLP